MVAGWNPLSVRQFGFQLGNDINFSVNEGSKIDADDENVLDFDLEDIAVYPNPTTGIFNVKAENIKQVAVVNMTGQVIMTQNVDNYEVMIDMSAFDNGMYLVNIITEQGTAVKILNVLK